jgi:SAM-dependent methyltransferase
MLKTIQYKNNVYPIFQSEGNAAQFAIPFALKVCKGKGVDVGCNRLEWCFPGAFPIDPTINIFDALNFPSQYSENLDYIFSSHCLEHLENWVDVLDFWTSCLKPTGVLFLYLPHYSQQYWRPWNNRKHKNIFSPEILHDYLTESDEYETVFVSGSDLNNSFMVMASKK